MCKKIPPLEKTKHTNQNPPTKPSPNPPEALRVREGVPTLTLLTSGKPSISKENGRKRCRKRCNARILRIRKALNIIFHCAMLWGFGGGVQEERGQSRRSCLQECADMVKRLNDQHRSATELQQSDANARLQKMQREVCRFLGLLLNLEVGDAPLIEKASSAQVLLGRHLVGVWIGGAWNGQFPICRSPSFIFQRPKLAGKSLKFRRKSIFAKFQAVGGSSPLPSHPEHQRTFPHLWLEGFSSK